MKLNLPPILLPPTPCTDGKWHLWSIHNVLWLLLPHHVVLLLQHGAPPIHKLLQSVSPFYKVQVPSGTHSSSMGSLQHHRSSQRSCSTMGFAFHRPQLLLGSPFSMGFPWARVSLRANPSVHACPLGGISATMGLCGLQWGNQAQHRLSAGESLLWHQKHLLPLLHSQLFLTYYHSSLLAALALYFFPFF